MSKHVRVPAPIQKVIPRIIRSTTGRLFLLVGSCAAVLAFGGSHYLLTRTTVTPKTTKPTTAKPSDAKVLGSATTEHLDDTAQPATPTTATPATTATTTPAASAPKQAASENDSTNASFDIEVGKITRSRTSLLLTVPFEIERHGGLSTPIIPGDVSITSNGLLITVQVQSKMLSDNSGVLTILPIGITSGTLNGHFSASSGNVMAGATFKYTL